jgi:hypothetical protein
MFKILHYIAKTIKRGPKTPCYLLGKAYPEIYCLKFPL